MKYLRFIRLFFIIVWRKCYEQRITIDTAYNIAKMVHLED